jgi:hypothetical protein
MVIGFRTRKRQGLIKLTRNILINHQVFESLVVRCLGSLKLYVDFVIVIEVH